MKGAMCFLRRKSKKATSNNPYSDRGLDKFCMVSAELKAKREKLAAELDTPLSMVRFAIGSHNKWIPIIISKSTRKGRQASKKRSTEKDSIKAYKSHASSLITEDKSILNGVLDDDKLYTVDFVTHDEMPGCVSSADCSLEDKVLCSGLQVIKGNTPLNVCIDKKSYLGGKMNARRALSSSLMKEDLNHLSELSSKDEDKAHFNGDLASKSKTSLDMLLIDGRASSRAITKEVTSAASDAESIAVYQGPLDPLQVLSLKSVMPDVPERANTASTIAIPTWSEAALSSLAGKCSKKHAGTTAWLKGETSRIRTGEMTPSQGAALKQTTTSKVKDCLNVWSAPSTPRDSRQPKGPFTEAGPLSKAPSFPELATCRHVKADKLVEKASFDSVKRSRLSGSVAISGEQLRSRGLGEALAAGLLLCLTGLLMGYVSALIGVMCWWYIVPILRKAVGNDPIVRSHSNWVVTAESKCTELKAKRNKAMVEDGCDLQFYGYPKRVIMEGLLDRSRGSHGSDA